jgi:hypothetical protein
MISDFDRAILVAHKSIAQSASDLEQHLVRLTAKDKQTSADFTRLHALHISSHVLLAEADKILLIKDTPNEEIKKD